MVASVQRYVGLHASSLWQLADKHWIAFAAVAVISRKHTVVCLASSSLQSRSYPSCPCNILHECDSRTKLRHCPSTVGANAKNHFRSLIERHNKVEPYLLQSLSIISPWTDVKQHAKAQIAICLCDMTDSVTCSTHQPWQDGVPSPSHNSKRVFGFSVVVYSCLRRFT